jgi:hypothetical protein
MSDILMKDLLLIWARLRYSRQNSYSLTPEIGYYYICRFCEHSCISYYRGYTSLHTIMSRREMKYIELAFADNWIAPPWFNLDEFEESLASFCGVKHDGDVKFRYSSFSQFFLLHLHS